MLGPSCIKKTNKQKKVKYSETDIIKQKKMWHETSMYDITSCHTLLFLVLLEGHTCLSQSVMWQRLMNYKGGASVKQPFVVGAELVLLRCPNTRFECVKAIQYLHFLAVRVFLLARFHLVSFTQTLLAPHWTFKTSSKSLKGLGFCVYWLVKAFEQIPWLALLR